MANVPTPTRRARPAATKPTTSHRRPATATRRGIPSVPTRTLHPAQDRQALKRAHALADPGLRSKLSDAELKGTPYLAMRQANARNKLLDAPVTPGSSMTERQLATASDAATTTRYAPQEAELKRGVGIAETQARDTGGFYDDYLARLKEHAANVAGYQQGAQQALTQTAAAVTGLGATDAVQNQQQANQAAAKQGVTQAGNLMPTADAAAGVRQMLMGSFQAQAGAQGAAANTAADATANRVGGAQKLTAQTQAQQKVAGAQQKVSDLKGEEGAFKQQYSSEQRSSEQKNVLAATIASGKDATDRLQLAETKRHNTAAESLGVKKLSADETKQLRDLKAKADQGTLNRQNKLDLQHLSDKQKQLDRENKKNGKGAKGPDWMTPAQANAYRSQASYIKGLAARAKAGKNFNDDKPAKEGRDRHSAKVKIANFGAGKIKSDSLLSAALDAVYDGHLSANTQQLLIDAGLKPSEIARTLGVPTRGKWKAPKKANASVGKLGSHLF